MLNHFKRKLTKLVAHGSARREAFRSRCLVERLEDRTMLSISPAGPPPGYGGVNVAPYAAGNQQKFAEATAYTSRPSSTSYEFTYYELESTRGPQGFGPSFYEL